MPLNVRLSPSRMTATPFSSLLFFCIDPVARKVVLGSKQQIEDALENSEDPEKINTSFIERLNLTIRRNVSYLHSKTPAHARYANRLAGQLELQRCYYNFMRPHMAFKFGIETYTPAGMAGIADRKLSWREIIEGKSAKLLLVIFCKRQYNENQLERSA